MKFTAGLVLGLLLMLGWCFKRPFSVDSELIGRMQSEFKLQVGPTTYTCTAAKK